MVLVVVVVHPVQVVVVEQVVLAVLRVLQEVQGLAVHQEPVVVLVLQVVVVHQV